MEIARTGLCSRGHRKLLVVAEPRRDISNSSGCRMCRQPARTREDSGNPDGAGSGTVAWVRGRVGSAQVPAFGGRQLVGFGDRFEHL